MVTTYYGEDVRSHGLLVSLVENLLVVGVRVRVKVKVRGPKVNGSLDLGG